MERSRSGLVMNRCEGWTLQGEMVSMVEMGDCVKYLGGPCQSSQGYRHAFCPCGPVAVTLASAA